MCFLSLAFEICVCSLCHWGQLPIPAVSSLKSKHGLRGRLEKQTSHRLLAVASTPPAGVHSLPAAPALHRLGAQHLDGAGLQGRVLTLVSQSCWGRLPLAACFGARVLPWFPDCFLILSDCFSSSPQTCLWLGKAALQLSPYCAALLHEFSTWF